MTDLRLLIEKLPIRNENSHKGSFGTLTVVGGSDLYRGAPALNVASALRCGVGVVRLLSSERVISSVSAKIYEAVYLPVKENEKGGIDSVDYISKQKQIMSSSSILVGCGMKESFDTEAIVSSLLRNYEGSLVIDADGLNSIKTCTERLKDAHKTPVITPHIGEMSRLTGISPSEIAENRISVAKSFASEHNCVVVLKDDITVIASPCGAQHVVANPNSGLSKGGSGDVLSGIIASLSAQGMTAYDAAVCGVILHSLSAKKAAEELCKEAMLPSDIIRHISTVYREIRKERNK